MSKLNRTFALLLVSFPVACLPSCSHGASGQIETSRVLTVAEDAGTVTPESLLDLIRDYERREVRLSFGELDYQCFTELDFQRFMNRKRHIEVARAIKSTKRFADIAKVIAAMPGEERNDLLARARHIAHPTWAQQGRITADGSGQTEAGRSAELVLAGAIVDALEETIRQIPKAGGPAAPPQSALGTTGDSLSAGERVYAWTSGP